MKITEAESIVMDVLWTRGPTDAETMAALLDKQEGWSNGTVRTLLQRLIQKKAVSRAKGGRRLVFTPLIERADYLHEESQGFLDRLFEGRLGPLAAQLAEREKLSNEDIAELKAIIARIEDGR